MQQPPSFFHIAMTSAYKLPPFFLYYSTWSIVYYLDFFTSDFALRYWYINDMKIRLKEIRIQKRLSIRQVEIATGLSRSAISRIEREEVSPSMEEMELLAMGLHMCIEDLYASDFKKRPDIGTNRHR